MTLGEAIDRMRASETEDFASRASPELEQLAEQHDAVHGVIEGSLTPDATKRDHPSKQGKFTSNQ